MSDDNNPDSFSNAFEEMIRPHLASVIFLGIVSIIAFFAFLVSAGLEGLGFILFAVVFLIFAKFFSSNTAKDNNNTSEFYRSEPNQLENVFADESDIINSENLSSENVPSWKIIISEQKDLIDDIKTTANGASGDLAKNLNEMVSILGKIESHLEDDSSGFSHVQRLYSYYVPQTASLLSARGAALRFGDSAKVAEIDEMIGRLRQAYEEYSMRLWGTTAQELKIDLQLLDQSLNAEFPIKEKI